MKRLGFGKGFWFGTLAIMILVALPATGFGQGRGRGNGRNQDWKCGKFVNCHDARDGRVDHNGRWDRRRNVTVFRNNDSQRNRQWRRFYNNNNRYQRQRYASRNRYRNRDNNRRVVRYRRY